MELIFTPMRNISDEEYEQVQAAREKPETKMYTVITVAQTDGVKKQPKPQATIERADEPEEEEVETEPKVRQTKKATEETPKPKKDAAALVDDWLSE